MSTATLHHHPAAPDPDDELLEAVRGIVREELERALLRRPSITPRVLTPTQAGHYLGRSDAWLARLRHNDRARLAEGGARRGPRWIDSGAGRPVYLRDDLDAWIDEGGLERRLE